MSYQRRDESQTRIVSTRVMSCTCGGDGESTLKAAKGREHTQGSEGTCTQGSEGAAEGTSLEGVRDGVQEGRRAARRGVAGGAGAVQWGGQRSGKR